MNSLAETLRQLSFGPDRCPECKTERLTGVPHAPHTCVTMREAANMIERLVPLADEGSEAFIMQWKKRAERAEAELEVFAESLLMPLTPMTDAIAWAKGVARRAERAEALIVELLDNFYPFVTAWEARDPWHCSDGEDLARRMREAIGRKDEV